MQQLENFVKNIISQNQKEDTGLNKYPPNRALSAELPRDI